MVLQNGLGVPKSSTFCSLILFGNFPQWAFGGYFYTGIPRWCLSGTQLFFTAQGRALESPRYDSLWSPWVSKRLCSAPLPSLSEYRSMLLKGRCTLGWILVPGEQGVRNSYKTNCFSTGRFQKHFCLPGLALGKNHLKEKKQTPVDPVLGQSCQNRMCFQNGSLWQ